MLAWILSSPCERQRRIRGVENGKRSTIFDIENSLLERLLLVLILLVLKIIRNVQYPRRNGLLCVSGHISSLVSLMLFGIPTKERKSAFPLILQRFLFSTLNPSNPFKSVSGKGAGVYPSHSSHCWPELMGKHKISAAVQAVHHF